ncbi:hypothetical protein Pyn_16958 [Prunus yedoensis var. nudiflora]|uniref:Uncharacterized protein n=1 Tax=Prunus yedoensis var. nudiflora TaxID=2094558 RepID=A0A314UDY2_PRUYE|nr:hypothetical protein Pyn_16958 [Prunus yedoensis var. nudiflora]
MAYLGPKGHNLCSSLNPNTIDSRPRPSKEIPRPCVGQLDKIALEVEIGRFGPTSCFNLIGRFTPANKLGLRDRLDLTVRFLLNNHSQTRPKTSSWAVDLWPNKLWPSLPLVDPAMT